MPDITPHLDGVSGASSAVIKNLGVTYDPKLSYKKLLGFSFFHLRNITKISKMLSVYGAEKLIHVFVTSRLDYFNALLSGCAKARTSLCFEKVMTPSRYA